MTARNGVTLPVIARETTWSLSFRNSAKEPIGAVVASAVSRLPDRSKLWTELLESGAKAWLILSVVGTKYQGDEISAEAVGKLAELNIALGLEVYAVPQNG